MKLVFISDIHGNIKNLPIIEKIDCDNLIVLGDLYHRYAENSEVLNDEEVTNFILRNKEKILCVKGNCDSENDYKLLGLPCNEEIKILDNKNVLMCSHGNKLNYYHRSYANEDCFVIYGHEHIPYIMPEGNTIYVCVGSISNPRQGSSASYAVYDNGDIMLFDISGKLISFYTKKKI